jgi:hypothetical protein
VLQVLFVVVIIGEAFAQALRCGVAAARDYLDALVFVA